MPADTTLTCRDCGQNFVFTSGEQDFYAARGYSEPSRCPDCRAARKAERGGGGGAGGGYSSYSSGSRGAGTREMFSAICSNCGQEARVPFQPSGDKPVYCSNCFNQRGGAGGAGGRGGYGGRGRY